MMSNEALETLLWHPDELKDIYSAQASWESFGEPGQKRISAAQIAQWRGAWKTYPEGRWMLLEVLEDYLPCADQWDEVKLWAALVQTPNSDPEISQMRHKFLDMGYDSKGPAALVHYVGVFLLGETARVGQLSVLDDCFDFAMKHGGQEAVNQLFLRQASWLMKKLSGYSYENIPEDGSRIWLDTLGRVGGLDNADTQMHLITTWAQVAMEEQSWGMVDWDACNMILSHLSDMGLNMDDCLAKVLEYEQQLPQDRVQEAVNAILTLGADWKRVDMDKVSLISKPTILNHPTARRERLMGQLDPLGSTGVGGLEVGRARSL